MVSRDDSSLLAACLERALSASCGFYRELYGFRADGILTAIHAENLSWSEVPFLTRADIVRVPLRERTFIPWRDVAAIRPTSGTSGRGIMCMARTMSIDREMAFERAVRARGATRIATMSGAQFLYAATTLRARQSIVIDPGDPATSATLIDAFAPDMLAGTCHALLALVPFIGPRAIEGIRTIALFGEWSSERQREELRRRVPRATVEMEYASIESQGSVAWTCSAAARGMENTMHPIGGAVHVEIVDPDTGAVIREEGAAGEIVVTTLAQVPFPLIRYKTGDIGSIVSLACTCGETSPSLRVDGRLEFDRIRIEGGEVQLTAIDVALVATTVSRFTEFQVAVRDRLESGRVIPQLVLRLPATALSEWSEQDSRLFSSSLRVAPERTYAQGVDAGLYAPLVLESLRAIPPGTKRRRLIREHGAQSS